LKPYLLYPPQVQEDIDKLLLGGFVKCAGKLGPVLVGSIADSLSIDRFH
jgi:hypothetical protein